MVRQVHWLPMRRLRIGFVETTQITVSFLLLTSVNLHAKEFCRHMNFGPLSLNQFNYQLYQALELEIFLIFFVQGYKKLRNSSLLILPKSGKEQLYSFCDLLHLFLKNRIIDAASEVEKEISRRLRTSILNRVVLEAVAFKPPPRTRVGKRGRVYYCTQAAIRPPKFVFFVNDAKLFPQTYRRYMERQLRADAGFSGTPIRLLWRSRRVGKDEGKAQESK